MAKRHGAQEVLLGAVLRIASDQAVLPPKAEAPIAAPAKTSAGDESRGIYDSSRVGGAFGPGRKDAEADRKLEKLEQEQEEKIRAQIKQEWGFDIATIHEQSRARFGIFIVNPFDEDVVAALRFRADGKLQEEKEVKTIIDEIKSAVDGQASKKTKFPGVPEALEFIKKSREILSHIGYNSRDPDENLMQLAYAQDLRALLSQIGVGTLDELSDVDFSTAESLRAGPFRDYLYALLKANIQINRRLLLTDSKRSFKDSCRDEIALAEKIIKVIEENKKNSGE